MNIKTDPRWEKYVMDYFEKKVEGPQLNSSYRSEANQRQVVNGLATWFDERNADRAAMFTRMLMFSTLWGITQDPASLSTSAGQAERYSIGLRIARINGYPGPTSVSWDYYAVAMRLTLTLADIRVGQDRETRFPNRMFVAFAGEMGNGPWQP